MNIPDYTKYKKNMTRSVDWRYKSVGFDMCNTYFGWKFPNSAYWYKTEFCCGATRYSIANLEGTKKVLTWGAREKLEELGSSSTWRSIKLDYDEILDELGKSKFDAKHIDIFVKRQTYGIEAYRLVQRLIHRKFKIENASS